MAIRAASLFIEVGSNTQQAERGLARVSGLLDDVAGRGLRTGLALSSGITAPLAAITHGVAGVGIGFESAFAGVEKTVEGTPRQLGAIRQGIRDLANDIPAAREEIAAVASEAGQLGVVTPAVLGFTRTMVDMGETTDLASTQAGQSLARLANITQMPQDQFDELGSTVVDLGNKLAATESEIVETGLRIAGAGEQIGLTEAQILGVAGALASVGIQSEMGGSAISRVMINIANAVDAGGEKLVGFARVAGMTAVEFSRVFRTDPISAIIAFVEGLGRIQDAGGNTFAVLESLELKEIRVRDTLLRLSGAGDLLARSVNVGTNAWRENNALTEEAAKRYETVESRLAIARNRFGDIGVTVYDQYRPAIVDALGVTNDLIGGVGTLVNLFLSLPQPVQNSAIAFGAVLAAAGPAALVLSGVGFVASALLSPFGLLSLGVAGLAAMFALKFPEMELTADSSLGRIAGIFSTRLPSLENQVLQGTDRMLGAFLVAFPGMEMQTAVSLGRIGGFLSGFAGEVSGWGVGIVEAIASGMISAVGAVVEAINFLGGLIAYWLEPHSPPNLLPSLDIWGRDAANIWLGGWKEADFGMLGAMGRQVEAEIGRIQGRLGEIRGLRVGTPTDFGGLPDEQRLREIYKTLEAPDLAPERRRDLSLQAEELELRQRLARLERDRAAMQERQFQLIREQAAATRELVGAVGQLRAAHEQALTPIQAAIQGNQLQQQQLRSMAELRKIEAELAEAGLSDYQRQTLELQKQGILLEQQQRMDRALELGVDLSALQNIGITAGDLGLGEGLSALQKELQWIGMQEQELQSLVRLQQARNILTSDEAKEHEKVAAALEIQRIEAERRQRLEQATALGFDPAILTALGDVPIVLDEAEAALGRVGRAGSSALGKGAGGLGSVLDDLLGEDGLGGIPAVAGTAASALDFITDPKDRGTTPLMQQVEDLKGSFSEGWDEGAGAFDRAWAPVETKIDSLKERLGGLFDGFEWKLPPLPWERQERITTPGGNDIMVPASHDIGMGEWAKEAAGTFSTEFTAELNRVIPGWINSISPGVAEFAYLFGKQFLFGPIQEGAEAEAGEGNPIVESFKELGGLAVDAFIQGMQDDWQQRGGLPGIIRSWIGDWKGEGPARRGQVDSVVREEMQENPAPGPERRGMIEQVPDEENPFSGVGERIRGWWDGEIQEIKDLFSGGGEEATRFDISSLFVTGWIGGAGWPEGVAPPDWGAKLKVKDLESAAQGARGTVETEMPLISGAVEGSQTRIDAAIGLLLPKLNTDLPTSVGNARTAWETDWTGMSEFFQPVSGNIVGWLADIDTPVTEMPGHLETLDTTWDTVWEGMEGTLQTVWSVTISPILTRFNEAIAAVQRGLDTLSGTPVPTPGTGGGGGSGGFGGDEGAGAKDASPTPGSGGGGRPGASANSYAFSPFAYSVAAQPVASSAFSDVHDDFTPFIFEQGPTREELERQALEAARLAAASGSQRSGPFGGNVEAERLIIRLLEENNRLMEENNALGRAAVGATRDVAREVRNQEGSLDADGLDSLLARSGARRLLTGVRSLA